jgi:hypothetical protein
MRRALPNKIGRTRAARGRRRCHQIGLQCAEYESGAYRRWRPRALKYTGALLVRGSLQYDLVRVARSALRAKSMLLRQALIDLEFGEPFRGEQKRARVRLAAFEFSSVKFEGHVSHLV